jgi:hypothetical protein
MDTGPSDVIPIFGKSSLRLETIYGYNQKNIFLDTVLSVLADPYYYSTSKKNEKTETKTTFCFAFLSTLFPKT